MKYNPLGSTFKEGETTLKVELAKYKGQKSCRGCWYNRKKYRGSCYIHGHVCTPYIRKDNNNVIFTEVK